MPTTAVSPLKTVSHLIIKNSILKIGTKNSTHFIATFQSLREFAKFTQRKKELNIHTCTCNMDALNIIVIIMNLV